ncbi:Aminopeptidase N3 [Operophtera brumata]|uniref:Aminopeptidase N3 n=1 Tax=Operophtera brumata TaxID=104452 RepID=A0A0L7LCB7_OPEBR|nr:Aminopeptidase N3 [Operophtera brumata]
MATMKLVVLAAVCICAHAFPQEPTGPVTRNTIFADERFEGEIFENLEAMEQFELSRNTDASSFYRLPNTTRPTHYDITWQIAFPARQMSGATSITLSATRADVNEIVLHADQMTIGTVTLLQGTQIIQTLAPILEEEAQFLRVPLASGSLAYDDTNPIYYTLTINFNAPLRTDMYGIYESWYRNDPSNINEPVSWMASTQFQATAARYAFPCYDEPSFKATFDIVIRRPTAFKSWACTRLNTTRESIFTGYQEDVFGRTPIMSTYLLAIIVAEYETKPHYSESNQMMYEVIARPGAMNDSQGDYAFDVGMLLLDEMSNHTALDFYEVDPNIKMTQAAIPDFSAGAMENWGLLTYREAYLMYDEANTNSYFKQLIAYILSHEIAHMWFGNLVTCDWWDVLWLNEGFARYYQYFLTDWVEDYMGLETRFITEQIHTSLLSDSANNPHPLSTSSIGSPAAVSSMFSTLTYNKGAAVIRMTEHLLGFDVHREGLRNYLVNKAFQTALPGDLFEALQNAAVSNGAISAYGSNFNVNDYYKSWTEQAGHPVLNVQVNHQTGDMTIYQRRFNINTGYSINNNNNYIVPVTFATASNPDFEDTKPTHIIRNAVTTISRGSIGDEWVVFNKQQTGFYRVNYDDYTWDLIVIALRGENRTQIHQYNRAQIVNDVFQFARSGLMSYTRAFNILSFLEFETEYAPWVAAITGFTWIRNRLAGTPYLAELELTYYPLPNEDFMASYLRYQLAPTLCIIDAPGCRTAATNQFRALVDQNTPNQYYPALVSLCHAGASIFPYLHRVPVDSRNWVYCNGLRQGSVADFTYLWNRFQSHNVYTEKIQILMVLGCTPHQAALDVFLNGIVTPNNIVRQQDYTTAFSGAVNGNEGNTQIVFHFGSAATPLSYVSARLRTEAEITAFQTWADNSAAVLGNAYQTVYNGASNSIANMDWVVDVQGDLGNYFENGDQQLQLSSPAPVPEVQISTVPPPALSEPVIRSLHLLVGLALFQGILTFSPIPEMQDLENEWVAFNERLDDPNFRLPGTTTPRHYQVSLIPYINVVPNPNARFTFDGLVRIIMSATETGVTEIVLHCNDLTINTLTVTYNNTAGNIVDITAPNQQFECDPTTSFLRVNTIEALNIDQEYIIESTFAGNLQTNMRGFYRSWYRDSTNATNGIRWMATTQFQPGHARQAFPCYDEPGFKAFFDISISRESTFSPSISNMPIAETSAVVNGRVTETFHTTPLTSTYLLAFIVSHYEVATTNNDPARPFQIYARDNIGNHGDWSNDVGQRLLSTMEAYTGIPYYEMAPYMNMKQAAIPDFSAGAMENWGLLTYREALILYDPLNSNHFYKQRVANIVSHEIAHMWFGNLVTCAWWDNLWLNEGFARFYQYYLTAMVEPTLGFETRFIVEQLQVAMISDSVDTAHALTNPSVSDPVSVSAHFSTITYARGAAVLRMTQHLLGDATFQKALRNYLKDREYNVAEPEHLFKAFDDAAIEDSALTAYNGITIDKYFKTWSEKAGHPLLTVVHYGLDWSNWVFSYEDSLFYLILTFSGFYRVNYDVTNWNLLTRALRTNKNAIHEYNRAQIVDDLFAFARATVLPYSRVFNILSYLAYEDDYAPWIAAITGFNFAIRRLAHDDAQRQELEKLIIDLSEAVVQRLGFSEPIDEDYMTSLQRMYVMSFLCDVGHEGCIAAARENFATWKAANMRPWVYCAGLRAGDATDFDFFWDKYLEEDLAGEQVVLIQAAGCTSDTDSLGRFWEAITAGDDNVIIRGQDLTTALSSAITANEENTMKSFRWLQVTAWLNQIRETLGESLYQTGLNAIATARGNIAWYQQRAPEFAAYFETGYVEQEIEPVEGGEGDGGDGGSGEGGEEGSGDGEGGETEGGETEAETDSANIAALSVITLIATLSINFLA